MEVLRFPRERFPDIKPEEHPELTEIPLIEPWTKFTIPYYSDDIVDILLAGTMDEVALQSRSCLLVVDCKTTGMWNVKEYLMSYKLDAQLMFYVMILQMYAEYYPDSIFAELLAKYPLGAMIDGVFYKGATEPVVYQRSDVFLFPEWRLNMFKDLLALKIAELIKDIHAYVKDGTTPVMQGMINGSCSTKYGPCKYSVPCSMPDEEARKIMLERYPIKHYNPLEFGGKH